MDSGSLEQAGDGCPASDTMYMPKMRRARTDLADWLPTTRMPERSGTTTTVVMPHMSSVWLSLWAKPPLRRAGMRSQLQNVKGDANDFESNKCFRMVYNVMNAVMTVVILTNAATVGLSCDFESKLFDTTEIFFGIIFGIELLVRGYLLGLRQFLFGSDWRWNVFDLFLTAQAFVDLIISNIRGASLDIVPISILRLVRIFRITRFVRIFKIAIFKDLLMMINGTFGGIKTLAWSMMLLAFPLYAFAIVLRETIGNEPTPNEATDMFRDVTTSFFTMFRCVVAGDCSTRDGRPIFVLVSSAYGWGFGVFYMFAMMFVTFGLQNVILAIYVENTVAAAKCDELARQRNRLRDVRWFQDRAQALVVRIWTIYRSHAGDPLPPSQVTIEEIIHEAEQARISRELFAQLLQDQEVCDILSDLDIFEDTQTELFETIDVEMKGVIGFGELMHGIRMLRGDARRSDVIATHLVIHRALGTLRALEDRFLRKLRHHGTILEGLMLQAGGAAARPHAAGGAAGAKY